jgi:HD-GYP domain-containing protein (c-di-GMP phosphodiesterase class II)
VEQTFERWDGKGVPKGAKEEEILVTSRLVTLADVVEVFHRAGGTDGAIAVARQRRGTRFDPHVVDVFTSQAAVLFAGLDEVSSWDAVIAAEPALGMHLTDAEFDAALEAVADFADVKSPYTIGHSRGVADLAGEAAGVLGLGGQAATLAGGIPADRGHDAGGHQVVLDSASRRILELPNPLGARGAGRYTLLGRGLRYRCALVGA